MFVACPGLQAANLTSRFIYKSVIIGACEDEGAGKTQEAVASDVIAVIHVYNINV